MSSTPPTVSSLPLKRVPRASLAQAVAEQLMEAIRDLEPGTRVPSERELTRMLGVSRTTLREALHGLAVLGAIEVRHGQGVYVAMGSPVTAEADELAAALAKGITIDLIEARRAILVEIARLAAARRTDEDLTSLEAVLRAHRRSIRANRSPVNEGIRFDLVLAAAAHNDVLAGALRSFSRLIWPRAEHLYATIAGFWQPDLDEHVGIFEAVKAGDGAAAAQRMSDHLGDVQSAYRLAGEA